MGKREVMADTEAVQDKWEFYTDLPVGEILRRTRVHYGQSLTDVEKILRIRAIQLEALETGDIQRLPGRVYAIGFVRAYSEYLGLDGNKMVQLFKLQSVGSQRRPELHFPASASESRMPGLWVLFVSAAMTALILLVWITIGDSAGPRRESIPEIPSDIVAAVDLEMPEAVAPPSVKQIMGPVQPSQPLIPARDAAAPAVEQKTEFALSPAEHKIVIRVMETSWVEIRNAQGKAILSRTLRQGDVYYVPREEGLKLTTGNGGGLEIEVDGQVLPKLGGKGGVMRGVALNADTLKKFIEKPAQ